MGASLGSGDRDSRDVAMNIVPLVDLMSCLTAFLLVAAVWVKTAQLDTEPQGRNRAGLDPGVDDKVVLSVLVQEDRIWIGQSRIDERREFEPGADPAALRAYLAEVKASAPFVGRDDIQIAAESTTPHPVRYQDVITMMELARQAGFETIALTDRSGLTTAPKL